MALHDWTDATDAPGWAGDRVNATWSHVTSNQQNGAVTAGRSTLEEFSEQGERHCTSGRVLRDQSPIRNTQMVVYGKFGVESAW